MRLPDFIIIGAAKAGTTSLHAMLDRHPKVLMSRVKEPEFFARDDRYVEGLAAYAQLFEDATSDQLVGEASTLYSLTPFFPETPARIALHLPDAKLIYILRNPVDRAYSYYLQLIKGYQNATKDYTIYSRFEDFILANDQAGAAMRRQILTYQSAHLPNDPELCLAGSDYVRQIEAFLTFFPRERMLFLKFETFRQGPEAVLEQITRFLGLDPVPLEAFAAENTKNISADHFDGVAEQIHINALRRRAGPVWVLRQFLPEAMRRRLRSITVGGSRQLKHDPPPLTAETRDLLSRRFARQLPRLEELTGLEFSDWRLSGGPGG